MLNFKGHQGALYFEQKGKGAPLVLLRGLGRSSRYWLGFDSFLSDYFEIIILDHRGLGRSSKKMSWLATIDQLADDLHGLLRAIERPKVYLFGLSLGGMVALSFALRYPAHCQSIIAANTSSADYLYWRINPLSLGKLAFSSLRGQFDEALYSILIADDSPTKRSNILHSWNQIQKIEGLPLKTISQQLIAAARFTLRPLSMDPTIPVTFLAGADDRFVPKKNSQKLAKMIPHAHYIEMKHAGHELTTASNYANLLRIIQSTHSRIG